MYKIIFSKKAFNFFKKLDKQIQERIAKKIEELKENPHLGIPLVGNLAGLWKLRTGDYRVVYQIKNNEMVLLLLDIGHRKNIYEEY